MGINIIMYLIIFVFVCLQSHDVLTNRAAVLQFLLKMSVENVRNGNIQLYHTEATHKPFSVHKGSESPASSFSKAI